MRGRSLSLFSFQFDIAVNLLFISTFFANYVNMQDTPHELKDSLRNYCFSSLDLCQKLNLKNIPLPWVTLENFTFLGTLWQDYVYVPQYIMLI